MSKTPRDLEEKRRYETFRLMYRKCGEPLMKLLLRKSYGDRQIAEEVYSQTLEAAWKGWHTFENKSSYFTWVCRIGLNKLADYYRNQVHERSIIVAPFLENLAELKADELSYEEKMALKELRASIRECLLKLPEEKQKILYLRYWKRMSIKKISQIFGISERAAEGKLYRSKVLLKKILTTEKPEFTPAYLKSR